MGMSVRYVGPKDFKTFEGQRFPRLEAVEVPNTLAAKLLSDPNSFLPASAEVPAETLAQRDQLPLAMEAEGRERIRQYQRQLFASENLPAGAINETTGKPDATMQRRIDSIKGAQDEIDYGESLIKQANALRVRIASEAALAEAPADKPKAKVAA